ncbi:hypothetical protein B296_00045897, partial [Ensete ventricosum]
MAHPLQGGTAKIDHRRLISAVSSRLREKSTVGMRVIVALARKRFFSRVRRRNVSPCREKDQGD